MEKHSILSDGYAGRASARHELDRRYSEIGISAVAAAVRYQGETKTKTKVRARSDDQARTDSAA